MSSTVIYDKFINTNTVSYWDQFIGPISLDNTISISYSMFDQNSFADLRIQVDKILYDIYGLSINQIQ